MRFSSPPRPSHQGHERRGDFNIPDCCDVFLKYIPLRRRPVNRLANHVTAESRYHLTTLRHDSSSHTPRVCESFSRLKLREIPGIRFKSNYASREQIMSAYLYAPPVPSGRPILRSHGPRVGRIARSENSATFGVFDSARTIIPRSSGYWPGAL